MSPRKPADGFGPALWKMIWKARYGCAPEKPPRSREHIRRVGGSWMAHKAYYRAIDKITAGGAK